MKSIKLFISYVCYFGTGFVVTDQLLEGLITDKIQVNQATQNIVVYLLILFWLVKTVWFIYDKFHLETRERKQNMRKTEEEIQDLKENHITKQ